MTRSTDFSSVLSRALTLTGIVALAAITLATPGATRMYSWPWSCAHAFACAVPILLLGLRLADARNVIVLPSRAWSLGLLAAALSIFVSALASPYRGTSLLWGAPLLSGIAFVLVVFDWLHSDPAQHASRRHRLLSAAGRLFVLVAALSLALWASTLTPKWREEIWASRNPFPLGHSNYTAGLALLMIPVFGSLAAATWGRRRVLWILAAVAALATLITSGSRGGLLGLTALALVNVPAIARALRLRLWIIALVSAIALAALFYFNPRARSLLTGERTSAIVRESNDQRSAMLAAGFALGHERPLLGWGPGTTPLAYPRVRHLLDGGVENVLELHDVPVQLYAEFGLCGVASALFLLGLIARAAWRDPSVRPVFYSLVGYGVFSITDWQIDIPIFTASLALSLAFLAPPPDPARTTTAIRPVLGGALIALFALFACFARPDPTPELNVRALTLARDPAKVGEAIDLFNRSLALNPDQEMAHFNLGWLLVTRDPAAAELHFRAAAQLVPDKGGVYFGLGIARLNQGHTISATRAFALETVNDPLFLVSPWWKQPAIAALRANALALTTSFLSSPGIPAPLDSDARYLIALIAWLENRPTPGALLGAANTSERVGYFARRPARPDFENASVRGYRRERIGYPVLMRNLDLDVPPDLFDVQENSLAATDLNFLFPRKGWLPAPLLLPFLGDAAQLNRDSKTENRK